MESQSPTVRPTITTGLHVYHASLTKATLMMELGNAHNHATLSKATLMMELGYAHNHAMLLKDTLKMKPENAQNESLRPDDISFKKKLYFRIYDNKLQKILLKI